MHRQQSVSADDGPRSGFERKFTSQDGQFVGPLRSLSEAQDLLRRFNPRLIGFGIAGPSSSHFFDSSELTDTGNRNEISNKRQEAK
jgi:hypothetical protein